MPAQPQDSRGVYDRAGAEQCRIDRVREDEFDTNDFRAVLSGSGSIKSFDLSSQSAGVVLSGSGNVEVNAITDLAVTISGSGNVYYRGNPTINSNVSGSGKVLKR